MKIPEIIVNQDSINELEKIKEDSLKMMFLVFEKKRRDSAQFSLEKIQYPDNNRSIIFPFFK